MKHITFGNGKKNLVIIPGLSIHSVMGLRDMIEQAYQVFTDEYTVYVFDREENIAEGYTVREMAADTAKAMKALHIEKADVFGASQGGMIAMYLAIDHPKLVHSLILGSTLARPNETISGMVEEWIRLAEKKDERGLLESFVDHVYSKTTLEAYRDVLISSNLGITEEEYGRFLILAKACRTFNCFSELRRIQCPVFVIGAEGDDVVTAAGSREIAKELGCKLYLYGGEFGHGVYDEAPDYKERCLAFYHDSDIRENE